MLLVEDDDALRTLTRLMLEDFGYGVVDAQGPREALELCTRLNLHMDALVTDVIMPGMRGPELAQRLRAMRPELAVLFLTGYSDEAVEGPCLRKPFTEEQLAVKLGEVLERPLAQPRAGWSGV